MDNLILDMTGVTKSFFGVCVLDNIHLRLRRGSVLGLVGENGAGKSTLVNILGGVVQPDSGQITLNGQPYRPANPAEATQAGIAFIHQELNLFANLSIAENIYIGGFPCAGRLPWIDRRTIRAQTRDLLASVGLDVSPDTLIEKLSPGERQLVEIAKALSTDASIIIFDEPTTSLTARETERLFSLIERLRKQDKALIYISHILNDVMQLADDIMVLRDGELVTTGPKAEFTVQRMISHMVGRDIEQLYPERRTQPHEAVALEVIGLSQTGVVENISFALHKGEVLGLFGLMGSGRTELARMLFGLDDFEKGEICIGGASLKRTAPRTAIQQEMAFVTENRREEGLLMDISIAENLGLVALRNFARTPAQIVARRKMQATARDMSGLMEIRSSGPIERQPAKSLSGGNQQKTVIGKWLVNKPKVFILDEPTRGVDVGAKSEIYSIMNNMAAEGAGVLFISSELEELIGVCDRILVMGNGEIRGEFARAQFDKEMILRAAFGEGGAA